MSSIWRWRTWITPAPRPKAHKPTASLSASTRRCWTSSIGSRSASASTARSPSCRPTLIRRCGRIGTSKFCAGSLRPGFLLPGGSVMRRPTMLTRMTDADWDRVVQVVRAVRSRRGDKGRNDRRFLEAVHYFCVHNITWRALPAEGGNWNSAWKRFWRLSRAGVFEAFFDALAAMSQTAHLVQMFASTVVRAHVSAAGAKGGQDGQALGRSRGGFSTKIHLKADLDGRPLAFHLTEGQAGDSPQFEILLDLGPDITPRAA